MAEFPPRPKFPAKSLKPEFIIHSVNDFVAIANNWAIGTEQIRSDKILNERETPLASLRDIKHQARNAFKSSSFEPTAYVKAARNAIKQVKDILAPQTGRNIYVYEKQPELYWHYGVLAYYTGNLEEAKDILENKVIPAFFHDLKMIEKVDSTLQNIEDQIYFEKNIGLQKETKQIIMPFIDEFAFTPIQK